MGADRAEIRHTVTLARAAAAAPKVLDDLVEAESGERHGEDDKQGRRRVHDDDDDDDDAASSRLLRWMLLDYWIVPRDDPSEIVFAIFPTTNSVVTQIDMEGVATERHRLAAPIEC